MPLILNDEDDPPALRNALPAGVTALLVVLLALVVFLAYHSMRNVGVLGMDEPTTQWAAIGAFAALVLTGTLAHRHQRRLALARR